MLRRAMWIALALVIAPAVGCQHHLKKAGSFHELEMHAMRLDKEFEAFHVDLKDLVFGIAPEPEPLIWDVYER